jgi:hypothetical protein
MRLDFALSIGSTQIADYQSDFQAGGPGAGWGYLFNSAGPLGNPANYTALTPSGGQYIGPSGGLVGTGAADPVAYPPTAPFPPTFPATLVRPGPGSLEDPGGIERAVIVAYTIQPEDLAAAGVSGPALVSITAYDFAVSALSTPDGMSARIYTKNDTTPIIEFSDDTVPPFPFAPGFRFETTLDPDPIPMGMFSAGETIYIALGANTFSVPEPAALSLLAPAGLILLCRRANAAR